MPSRLTAFYEAIRRYYPGLRDGTLQPGYTGILELVNLFGIESPGLTASMAIADNVAQMLE